MPCLFQIFSQSDYLFQIVDINLHTEWQTVQIQISWLLRSQLIWIYTVCKGRVYPGSARQGLIISASHFCSGEGRWEYEEGWERVKYSLHQILIRSTAIEQNIKIIILFFFLQFLLVMTFFFLYLTGHDI